MARARSILHVRDSSSLVLTYRKNNPSTGLYFNDAEVTACTAEVRNADTGAQILAPTAMAYVAGLDGYRLAWAYGANLDGVRAIAVRYVPTRAGSVAAALAPSTTEDYDLADILQRVDENEALRAADEALTQAAVAAVQAKANEIDGEVGALQADFNSFETTNQAEHDASQAAIAVARSSIEGKVDGVQASLDHGTHGLAALNADLDALLARIGVDGAVTLHQKLGALTSAENLKAILGDLSTTKRLGQVLGAFTEAATLKAAADAIKADTAGIRTVDVPTIQANVDACAVPGDAMALTSAERTTLVGLVWSAATRTLTSLGSVVGEIWAALRASYNAAGSMGEGMNMLVPAGARVVTLTFRDSVSLAGIEGVLLTVRNSTGSAVIANQRTTNASGQVILSLPDGTYQVAAYKSPSYPAFTPTSITVSAGATTFTFDGAALGLPAAPADPAQCAVYFDTAPPTQGIECEAELKEDVFTVNDQAVVPRSVKATTGADGRAVLTLYRVGSLAQISGQPVWYRFKCQKLGISVEIEVPNAASAAVADIIKSY